MDLLRIGDKVISRNRVLDAVNRMLDGREQGASQQEVAQLFGVDRSFLSWLEKLGAIRKGRRIAVVGFPVANREQLEQVCHDEGVEHVLLMTDRERWDYVEQRSGLELFNEVMSVLARIRTHDVVILLGSDRRLRFLRALIDKDTLEILLGTSPIQSDVHVEPERLREAIRSVRT